MQALSCLLWNQKLGFRLSAIMVLETGALECKELGQQEPKEAAPRTRFGEGLLLQAAKGRGAGFGGGVLRILSLEIFFGILCWIRAS